jgi:broad specificity phosphatase PhoE
VIKAIVADALGLHLDHFQRISVEPCSVTAIRYTPLRPFLLRLGDTGDLTGLAPRPASEKAAEGGSGADSGDAVIGGDTGVR